MTGAVATKPVSFCGRAQDDLRGFPSDARREIGNQLYRVQNGEEPHDWKTMRTVGPGVREIRVATDDGAFRAVYVATMANAVYVLHCFQKKTRKTLQRDIDLAKKRLKDLMKELGE